ncbi:MAG: hypothetical protein LBJ46_05745 [Planctomycetota bacterium]|jgi:hypothetical protein|nr:hypothetical protein [Planctomycetota bacterium]
MIENNQQVSKYALPNIMYLCILRKSRQGFPAKSAIYYGSGLDWFRKRQAEKGTKKGKSAGEAVRRSFFFGCGCGGFDDNGHEQPDAVLGMPT